ncbi:MAG: LOG family protein [Gomphosphaeria aponina SAG 52.96 = DSM 107014]|uniref:LOG family protein n=1 Tax=Gomphosphaeria aponina SAG 52.96 = DSM 107014 TaxID=1521640 RepID=A0A941GUM7_9CHRO|nr:LOG family protein [Gomphosphaeria aponina SAG 52.96 = DSM 107014]
MVLAQQENIESPAELITLIDHLPKLKHGKLIQRALEVLVRIANEEVDRLDWKILTSSLEDLEKGFQTFSPFRHIRKVAIFGSARIAPDTSEYHLAVEFARCVTQLGFMVLTGAGGGIMQAANEGATRQHSFGLNIQLPFEQTANKFILGDQKLINFKYFFTRKLFFLRESDAVALFPGGFGTQDEAFETLTLCQTGKYGPAPLVLIDQPGGDYWHSWNDYICKNLIAKGLISPEDVNLYTITDDLHQACAIIGEFYRVYHSSRFVGQQFVMRLNAEIPDEVVEQLNEEFRDIFEEGSLKKTQALPEEKSDPTANLPRLMFQFNQKKQGRLYQMIGRINQLGSASPKNQHPERK